jgi:hypothetical protein
MDGRGDRYEGRVVELQDDSFQHYAVLPALHRRGLQERRTPAKQRARYWFDLQFRFVRLLNIPTWSNHEEGSNHTDIWTHLVQNNLDYVKVLVAAQLT